MNTIKKIMREPLVHFLLIGAGLFLLFQFTNGLAGDQANRIIVTAGQVEQMNARFSRTWMRQPTEKELAGLIENHVRDEVYYREALAMGLDQNDPLVRRRLRMKLEFMLEDLSAEDVTDEVLINFLQQNPDKFRSEAQISFQQVYLNADKREDLVADAKNMLASLNGGAAPDSVGDPILVPSQYRLATQSEIERTFGERFAKDVIKLAPGEWMGPVHSAYGAHLLKVSERVEARQPTLADIRALVEREYLVKQRKEQKTLAYQKLREGYQVTIEPLRAAQGNAAEIIATAQANEAQ